MNLQQSKCRLSLAAILWLACATVAMAQVKTEVTEQAGQATHETKVERGEVVYVAGNDLVVRMEDGQIQHFTVPDGAKATVNGKEYTIKDLQPGMKLERTITTTSTEKTVKTVKSGMGTVVNIMPPSLIVLRFEDGSVQQFKIPKNQTFMIDGKKLTAFEVKKGMKVSATRIVEEPTIEVSQRKQVTGVAPPPPPATPPIQGALLIAEAKPPAPASVPVATNVSEPAATPTPEPSPTKLPTTGSLIPLIGVLGLFFSGASFVVRLLRRS